MTENASILLLPTHGSSNLESAGYNPDTQTAHAKFSSNGAVYEYIGVTQQMWNSFETAESQGAFLRKNFGQGVRIS